MPKKAMESLTETMFYVLMALRLRPMCGIEAADWIEQHTKGRMQLGPATLYTILSRFEKDHYIREIQVEGRKRTYEITEKGLSAYQEEVRRLRICLQDAEQEDTSL